MTASIDELFESKVIPIVERDYFKGMEILYKWLETWFANPKVSPGEVLKYIIDQAEVVSL